MGSAFAKGGDKTNPTESDRLLNVDEAKFDRLSRKDSKSYGTLNGEVDTYVGEKDLNKGLEPVKQKKAQSRPFKDLYYYSTGFDRILIGIGCLTAVISGIGMPMSAIVFGQLANTFITGQMQADKAGGNSTGQLDPKSVADFSRLANISCIYYAILGVVIFASGYVQLACWQIVCERQVNAMRRNFFKAVLRQDIAWFDVNASGSLTIKLSDNLERIKEAIGDKLGILLQSFVQFIAGFTIAFIYSWKLTLIMVAISPLVGICGWLVAKLVSDVAREEQENYANAGAIAEEVLSCMRTVIAFNGQKHEINRYQSQLAKGRAMGIRKALYSAVLGSLSNIIIFTVYGIAFYMGGRLIIAGEVERGSVFTVFSATMGGAFVIGRAGPQFSLIQAARGAATSMLDIIDREPIIDCASVHGKRIHDVKGNIKLHGVHFSYETRKDVKVLDGIDLDIKAGDTIALVGHSGCGKSTIMSLLLRFYNTSMGKVTLDGENITDLNINWLRNTVGVVSQEPVLFDMTIEENIRMGRKDITHAELIRACKMANCHEFIRLLPQGYKSMVGERGGRMSGGQKQRIAIARALVRNPKILLLDEATSALDTESERLVQAALDKASKGRTTISIAHRLSTVRNCKKIVAMEKGKIQEMGTHEELIKKEGLYYNLVLAQQLNETEAEEAEDLETGDEQENSAAELRSKYRSSRSSSVLGRSISRSMSRNRRESMLSEDMSMVSDHSIVSVDRRRAMTRMMSTADTERERMENELKQEGAKQASLARILKECEGQWVYLIGGVLCAIIQGVIMPVFSQFYSQMFAAFAKEGQALLDDALFWGFMFLLLGTVDGIEYFFGEICFGFLGENVTLRMRTKVFTNVMRQDVSYFDDPNRSVGKICTRLATDAPNVKQAISWRVAGLLSAVVSMVTGIVIGIYYGWQLSLLVLTVCPFVAFGMAMRIKMREKSASQDSELLEHSGKVAVEAIENIRTVQSLTREKDFYETFCGHLDKPYQQAKKEAHIQAIFYGFAIGVYFWMYAISFTFAAFLVGKNIMQPLAVFKVFFGINFSTMMLAQATSYFPEYFKAQFAGGLIFKMLEEKPLIDSFGQQGLKPKLTGTLEFSDIEFTYPSRPDIQVMNSLSFKVEQGKTLALVGPSGCGKSTTIGLIERFYDPMTGRVRFDEFDSRTLNVAYMRDNIGLVSQEPVLFDLTIADNIAYGLENVTQERVHEAARKANIHKFIVELPLGYETKVGEKGTQLSGGQKQRIAIARALIRDPKVLLLDEATSALDSESEKVVQEALDRAREGRTSIIIAHRLSTVQNADSIAVIRAGKVIEQGTHDELVRLGGAYFELTNKQTLK